LRGGRPVLLRSMLSPQPRGTRAVGRRPSALTLTRWAQALRRAGLQRVNVSLDSLRPEVFAELTRRDLLHRVLDGLEAAARTGFAPIKVNVVVVRGSNDDQILDFALLTKRAPYSVRFLEY